MPGVPAVRALGQGGLQEIAVHPNFAQNQILYLTYTKGGEGNLATTALTRARFDGKALAGPMRFEAKLKLEHFDPARFVASSKPGVELP